MSIGKLIQFIQETYPPKERFPYPEEPIIHTPNFFPEIIPIDRPQKPDWINSKDLSPLPEETELIIEGHEGESLKNSGISCKDNIDTLPDNIDTLAFYLPFHFYKKWGIFLKGSGLVSVALLISNEIRFPINQCLLLAKNILFKHEHFHFQTEIVSSQSEVFFGHLIYPSYFNNKKAASLEEALANAFVIRTLQRIMPNSDLYVLLRMLSQGPGYRDFYRFIHKDDFNYGCRSAIYLMLNKMAQYNLEPTEFLYFRLSQAKTPVYLVLDIPNLFILKPFPKYEGMKVLVHTNDHPPPHIHIQIPPGQDYTRYSWPNLMPLGNDPQLSRKQKQSLDLYIKRYGIQINNKINEIYKTNISIKI